MNKLCFIDTETTGTDPKTNAIIQLAGIICKDDIEVATFNFHIAPFEKDMVDDKALAVSGITREQLVTFEMPHIIHQQFSEILGQHVDKFNRQDKFFFIGYNARFDADFVRSWFEKCGDQYFGSWFYFPPIDVMNLAIVKLMDRRAAMKDFKLATVSETLGLKPEGDLHDAMTDIRLTRQLFNKLRG